MSCDCVTQLAAAACAPSSRPPRSPSASSFPRPRLAQGDALATYVRHLGRCDIRTRCIPIFTAYRSFPKICVHPRLMVVEESV